MTDPGGLSRRGLLSLAGATAAGGIALGAVGEAATGVLGSGDDPTRQASRYRFTGAHQAGITTPAQDRLHLAAFDMTAVGRDALVGLMRTWTDAARAMVRGAEVGGGVPLSYEAPPADTGEALGLPPSRLTITFGFGPSLFDDRYGLASQRPPSLEPLPHFPHDALDPARSDGDLVVQACADDPQVAVHAIRNLARLAFGSASVRWSQLGFGRTSSTSRGQQTPRNLFGFKDGTANITAEQPDALRDHVWVAPGDGGASADWLVGGSYLVARRISMQIETWDRTSLREQEGLIGRDRAQGAPLSGGSEHSRPDFAMAGSDGPIIPRDAHVRLAHPSSNGGVRMLRRGYSFTDGSDPLGRLDAGLFFLAFVRDPVTHYIPMQTKLAQREGLAEYLRHTGSALFAVPPGVGGTGFVGETLLT